MKVIEQGRLKGSFKGFNDMSTVFEFFGGKKWQQAEDNYNYYYTYMPNAKVIDDDGHYFLEVDEINDKVAVKKIFG